MKPFNFMQDKSLIQQQILGLSPYTKQAHMYSTTQNMEQIYLHWLNLEIFTLE